MENNCRIKDFTNSNKFTLNVGTTCTGQKMLIYGGNFVPFNLIPDIMNRMSLHISQIKALTTVMGSYLKVGAMGGKFGLDEVTKVGLRPGEAR